MRSCVALAMPAPHAAGNRISRIRPEDEHGPWKVHPNMNPSAASLPQLNAHLASMQPYPPGKPIEEVQREFGLDSVIKLASNENPLGPSPRALKALTAAAREMNLYPDGAGFYLKSALAKRLGVAGDELVLGNGSDEIMTFLAQCYLNPRRELITSNYAFLRYAMAAQLVGARATLVPMRSMRHDLKAIARNFATNEL